MFFLKKNTIVALATSDGHGAIAIIRITGYKSFSIISNLFKPLKKGNKISLGYIFDKKEKIDKVIVLYFKSPNSYTGEDLVEVSCHGSPYIYRKILHLLIKSGIRMAHPGEFTMRAYLNGKIDLSQAEAISTLIYSESQLDHKLSLNQLRGEIYKQIQFLRKKFINFASILEISIDFSSEEVLTPNYYKLFNFLFETKKNIHYLLESFQPENLIKKGIQVVIIGGTNVGKSTLMNTLVKYDRAIVSDIHGTTRDFIEEIIYLHGFKFKLVDTAGIRPTKNKIESIGIQLTFDKISNAQVILYLFDIMDYNRIKIIKELSFIKKKYTNNNCIIIINKFDISNKYFFLKKFTDILYNISAKNLLGLEVFLEVFYKILDKDFFQNKIIYSNIRYFEILQIILSIIDTIFHNLEKGFTDDLIASDIRRVLYYLGKISGEITTDELLETIFSQFCIGK